MIGRYFGLQQKPSRFFDEARHADTIRVRLDPQLHEIIIPPPLNIGNSGMTPQQQIEYDIINRLRDVAQEAAHLVIHAGLEAFSGQKQDPQKTADLVLWALTQKDIEIEAAANRIADLEKQLDEAITERNVLAKVLRREG